MFQFKNSDSVDQNSNGTEWRWTVIGCESVFFAKWKTFCVVVTASLKYILQRLTVKPFRWWWIAHSLRVPAVSSHPEGLSFSPSHLCPNVAPVRSKGHRVSGKCRNWDIGQWRIAAHCLKLSERKGRRRSLSLFSGALREKDRGIRFQNTIRKT